MYVSFSFSAISFKSPPLTIYSKSLLVFLISENVLFKALGKAAKGDCSVM